MLRTPHILYIRLLLYRALPHRRGEGDTGHITNPHHELRRQLRCIRNVDMLGQAVRAAAQLPSRAATGATFTRACTPARRSATLNATCSSPSAATPRAASIANSTAASREDEEVDEELEENNAEEK